MLTEWREEMATGNKEIDEQHQELLRRVEVLLRAVKSLRGSEEIHKTIWFLKGYVRKHFRMEEKFQLDCGFPGYLAHKTQHEVFVRQVRRLEAQHSEEGASTAMIVAAVLTMCNWLRLHFDRMDKKMVEYARVSKGNEFL